MPWLLFTPGKDPVPIVQEAGWAPGLVWTGAENLSPTGNRCPDRPAGSQLLYRLRYLAHSTGRLAWYIYESTSFNRQHSTVQHLLIHSLTLKSNIGNAT